MMYLGDFPADQAIYFMWNTNDAGGASVTRTGDGTISVYKDASNGTAFNTTQVTTGVTNDEDFDALVGVHSCCITTTNAWYETGHDYVVVLSASTIDGETVNAVIATFSIENRYMVGTDSAYTGTPPTVTQIRQEMDANSTKMAPSQTLNDYKATGFNTTTPPTVGAIRTEMEGAGTKLTLTLGDTDELQGNQAAWVTAVGFSTHSAADIWSVGTRALTDKSGFALSTAGINAIWDDLISGMTAVGSIGKLIADNLNATITSRAPANEYDTQMGYIPSNLGDVPIASELNSAHGAGSWATATGFSTHNAAAVWSVATRILTANTNFNDLDAAAIKAEAAAALQDIKLDHLINIAVDTDWATTVHLDSVIGHMADVGTAATFNRTTDALEALRSRGDAEWITATGFNTTTPPTVGEIRTEMEGVGTKITGIKDKTDNIPASPASSGEYDTEMARIDVDVSSRNATTPPTVGAIRTEMEGAGTKLTLTLEDTAQIGAAGAGLTDLGGMSSGMKTEVNDQVVDVIKTDTTAEMSQGAPPATPTFEEMIAYIYFKLRNKGLTTATEDAMYADDGTTKIMKATLSDNGTTFEKSEYVSGA